MPSNLVTPFALFVIRSGEAQPIRKQGVERYRAADHRDNNAERDEGIHVVPVRPAEGWRGVFH
ncbi:MAG: hypothetical protein F2894_06540 [Actinobacteria bacterium]|nr:hypothetical protein [Actinomycetota bacterium]MSW05846.1 hypothetical protein [Actinomycetota bacterium]MSX32747.1 hypothetical protein [Actinomycetota bacterium]MSX81374.1 hypothetical protein [Actinomycetota bacterium]